MKSSEEKRWERMQQILAAEANGAERTCISSQRTLFGIKSHAEEVIERTAAEIDAKNVANARRAESSSPSD